LEELSGVEVLGCGNGYKVNPVRPGKEQR